jgi:hypothetical protein
MAMDQNMDGRLSKEELPAQMQERLTRMDANGDGFVDRSEAEALELRFRQRGSGRGARPR